MKKLIASVLAIVLIISIGSISVFAESYRIGDVNSDGSRNADDLALLKQQLLSVSDATAMSDVNEDKNVDIMDLVRLKKYLVHVDSPAISVGELEIDGK